MKLRARKSKDDKKPGVWKRIGEKSAKFAATLLLAGSLAGASACGGRTALVPPGPDSGLVDAGPDAGTADSGTTDAGPPPPQPPPGQVLIGDYLNRELGDREDNVPGDADSAYAMGGS